MPQKQETWFNVEDIKKRILQYVLIHFEDIPFAQELLFKEL
jgi:hypothetical protein